MQSAFEGAFSPHPIISFVCIHGDVVFQETIQFVVALGESGAQIDLLVKVMRAKVEDIDGLFSPGQCDSYLPVLFAVIPDPVVGVSIFEATTEAQAIIRN